MMIFALRIKCEMRDKVKVIPNEQLTDMQSVISIHDGSKK